MSKPVSNILPIEMYVAHVGAGGNTANGDYFYCCVPQIVSVRAKRTPIEFRLSEQTDPRFEIVDVFHSAAKGQIELPIEGISGRSITVMHKNTHKLLTFFSIVVHDNKLDRYVNCDPQATNIPPD